MAFDLRPLDFGDRLGAAFKLYGSNFVTLVAIVAVIIIPLQLLSALVGNLLATDVPVTESGVIDVDALDAGVIVGIAATAIALAIITAIGALLATAGAMKAIADDALGRKPHWQDSLGYAFSKIGALIAGTVLYALGLIAVALLGVVAIVILGAVIGAAGVVVGGIALIAALIALVVSWSIWVPVVIVEDKGGFEALGRSNQLIDGRRWPVLGYLITMAIIVGLINAVLGGILLGIFDDPASPAQTVVNIALAVLTTPITAAAIVVLYFDQRVRSEAFDARDLAAQMGSTDGDPFGSLPPDDLPPEDLPPEPPTPEGF